MNKIVKSAICIAVSVSIVTSVAIWASGKKKVVLAEAEQTTVSEKATEATAAVPTTTATTATTEPETTTAKAEESTTASVKVPETTKTAVTVQQKEVVRKSELLKNANSVQRWETSGNGMSARVEKIRLNLNVYENGQKTSKTVQRDLYLAVVKGSAEGFRSISAKQSTGKTVDTIANIAKGCNACFAVNGEMCNHSAETFDGFYNAANDQPTATVIKNGIIPQAVAPSPSLTMDKNGVWEYPVIVSPDNAQDLISQGVITSVSYTYPVIWRGEPYYHDGIIAPMWNERDIAESNPAKHFYNSHTLIGQINANTYIVAVSEGFGRGYLCDIMTELGVQNAFWANGGHCSAIYVKGAGVINRPGDTKLCLTADVMGF